MKNWKIKAGWIFLIISIIYSCNTKSSKEIFIQIENKGKTLAENGKGGSDSIIYECINCKEYIKDTLLFQNIIKEATIKAKNNLKYPLSFVPKKIELTLIKEDSIFYFETNKKIENIIQVIAKYFYIGNNTYGNELEGDALLSLYIKDSNIEDLEDQKKLDSLKFDKYINRDLVCYNEDGEFIKFIPYQDKSIIVKSSLSCVDEDASFRVILENKKDITIYSWNDFNCDGNAYYKWFNKSQINELVKSRIKYLYIYSRGKSVMVNVPINKSDYMQQLMYLIK